MCRPSPLNATELTHTVVPSQFVQPCSGLKVPHRHRHVLGARDDVPPVATQRHGSHLIPVPSQFVQPCSGLEIPHRDRTVLGARDDVPPVAAHRHGHHTLLVAGELVKRTPVPKSHTATVRSSEPETMCRPSDSPPRTSPDLGDR